MYIICICCVFVWYSFGICVVFCSVFCLYLIVFFIYLFNVSAGVIYVLWFVVIVSCVFSFVLFRAETIDGANNIISSMLGMNGIEFIDMFQIGMFGASPKTGIAWIILSLLIVNFLPNTQQFVLNQNKVFINWGEKIINKSKQKIKWNPTLYWGIFFAIMLAVSVISFSNTSKFLYFQF